MKIVRRPDCSLAAGPFDRARHRRLRPQRKSRASAALLRSRRRKHRRRRALASRGLGKIRRPSARSRPSSNSASTPKSSTPPTAKPAKRVLVTGGGDASFGGWRAFGRFLPNPKPVAKTPLGKPFDSLNENAPDAYSHIRGVCFSQSEIALFLNCCLLIHITPGADLKALADPAQIL